MRFPELQHNAVLCKVGVLILVHQKVAELCLIACQHIGMVAKQQEGIEQQVVEVHGIGLPATLPVTAVDIFDGRHTGTHIVLLHLVAVGIH